MYLCTSMYGPGVYVYVFLCLATVLFCACVYKLLVGLTMCDWHSGTKGALIDLLTYLLTLNVASRRWPSFHQFGAFYVYRAYRSRTTHRRTDKQTDGQTDKMKSTMWPATGSRT